MSTLNPKTHAANGVDSGSRGIGLELVRQIVAVPNNLVVAAVRNPDAATQLKAIHPAAGSTLHPSQLDGEHPRERQQGISRCRCYGIS